MLNRLFLSLMAIVLAFAASLGAAQAADALKFSGEVTYRERMALPPDAQLRLSLVPLAQPTVPVVGATSVIDAIGQVPLQFAFDVRSTVVDDGRQYGLSAEILSGGIVVFASDAPVAVNIEQIAPISILVRRVGIEPVTAPPTTVELFETVWTLDTLGGQPVAGQAPTLSLAANARVGGNSGCNSYFGSATLKDSSLNFGALGGTRMACAPSAMAQETAFLAALSTTASYSLEGSTLTLFDGTGADILRFYVPR